MREERGKERSVPFSRAVLSACDSDVKSNVLLFCLGDKRAHESLDKNNRFPIEIQ